MKKRYCFYFLLVCLIPLHVHAYELNCDVGPLKFNTAFYCTVIGPENVNYTSISGTIKENEYASCMVSYDGNGLTSELETKASKNFSYRGRTLSDVITQYKCQVIKKPASDMQIQLQIDNFKYQVEGETSSKEEVLRSNSINLLQYIEPTTITTTKPRDTSNSNARLKSITDPSLNFSFSGFKTEYNLQVPFEVQRLNLSIEPFNKEASIRTVGNMNLSVGNNMIDIYVTSPDGKARTCYTLTITRLEEGKKVYQTEEDSSLSNLTIIGHSIPFKKETLEYSIHLDKNTSSLKIEPVTSQAGATYAINKTEGLQNGDRILITVTSPDKSTTTVYQIKVTKDVPKKSNIQYFILGGLGIVVFLVLVLIIYTNKKNKNDPIIRLKKEKKRKNKGKKFNDTLVPEAESQLEKESIAPVNNEVMQNIGATGTQIPNSSTVNVQGSPVTENGFENNSISNNPNPAAPAYMNPNVQIGEGETVNIPTPTDMQTPVSQEPTMNGTVYQNGNVMENQEMSQSINLQNTGTLENENKKVNMQQSYNTSEQINQNTVNPSTKRE